MYPHLRNVQCLLDMGLCPTSWTADKSGIDLLQEQMKWSNVHSAKYIRNSNFYLGQNDFVT